MAEDYITQYYTWVTGNTITAARLNGNLSNIIDGLSGGSKAINVGKVLLNSVAAIDSARIAYLTDAIIYKPSNNGNPAIRIGALDAEEAYFQAVYDSGAQTLDYLLFKTEAASSTAHKGRMIFQVDESEVIRLNDYGIQGGGSANVFWMNNIAIVRDTTTNAGDSIKITSRDGTAFSSTNYGTVAFNDPSNPGQIIYKTITSDVTINLTGAHFGNGTRGDLTNAILIVYAINDNGTLKWGISLTHHRTTLTTSDTTATGTSATAPESVLCNSAVSSSTNHAFVAAYFYASFDDTGGAAEDLWAVNSGVGSIVMGVKPEGIWRPFNPTLTSAGTTPTFTLKDSWNWAQIGNTIFMRFVSVNTSGGTAGSGANDITGTAPTTAANVDGNASTITKDGVNMMIRNSSTATMANVYMGSNSRTISFLKFASVSSVASLQCADLNDSVRGLAGYLSYITK